MPTNPIKLCLATPSYFPIYSGPALRFKNYLPGFKKRGVIAEVFSGTPSQAELTTSGYEVFWKGYKTGEVMPASMVDDVPVHCVCLPEGHPWKRASTYNRTLARYSQYGDFHPDLIQFLSLPLAAIPALVKLRRLGIPTIFTHTLLADLSPNPYKRVLQRFLWRFPFQFVDLIIVSSSVMQARLQHDLRLKTPIEVIPNGVCLSRFRPANTSDERLRIRTNLGISAHAPVIINVGPISPRKGHDLLLKAWAQFSSHHPEAHLLLVGPRHDLAYSKHDEFRQTIQSLAQASVKPENVHFLGGVTNVEDYLRTSDIFVFTSHREGMPNVIPEAMGVGLPVVTTPFIGLPEEFGQAGNHYLLVERDPKLLSTTLDRLLDQPDLLHGVGMAGQEWIRNTMDVEHSIDSYVNLYRSLK